VQQTTTILQQAVSSMKMWLHVYNVRELGGKYRLFVDKTWYLNTNSKVILGSQQCKVLGFALNQYIDVKDFVPVGKYLIPNPTFVHGKYSAVNSERAKVADKSQTTPLIWLFENFTRQADLNPLSAIDSTGEVRLFLLNSAEKDFNTDLHYKECIEPMSRNVVPELLARLKNSRHVAQLNSSKETNHAAFTTGGKGIDDAGKTVFNQPLSGVELALNFDIYKPNPCFLERNYGRDVMAELEIINENEVIADPFKGANIAAELQIDNDNEVTALPLIAKEIAAELQINNDNVVTALLDVESPPQILSVDPAVINQGNTEEFTITGVDFTGVSSVGQIDFGAGITVDSIESQTSTLILVRITAAYSATLGNRTLEITFDDNQVATLVDALSVDFTLEALNFIAAHESATGVTMATLQRSTVNGRYQRLRGAFTTNGTDFLGGALLYRYLPYTPSNDTTASFLGYAIDAISNLTDLNYVNFVAGDINVNGVTGGTSKCAQSSFVPSVDATAGRNSFSFFVYSRTNEITNLDCGITTDTPILSRCELRMKRSNDFVGAVNSTSQVVTTGNNTIINDTRGLIGLNRVSSANFQIVQNGVVIDTRTNASAADLPNLQFCFHGVNLGGLQGISTRQYCTLIIAKGLTANQLADLNELVQWENTNIITGGRNV
jgi:hypothetical protein